MNPHRLIDTGGPAQGKRPPKRALASSAGDRLVSAFALPRGPPEAQGQCAPPRGVGESSLRRADARSGGVGRGSLSRYVRLMIHGGGCTQRRGRQDDNIGVLSGAGRRSHGGGCRSAGQRGRMLDHVPQIKTSNRCISSKGPPSGCWPRRSEASVATMSPSLTRHPGNERLLAKAHVVCAELWP